MEAKDLRIGNYVNHINKPFKVTINSMDAISKIVQPSIMYTPIPLTEEILLKCGFGYAVSKSCMRLNIKDDLYIWFDKETNSTSIDTSTSGIYINFKYLHQLQNLFHSLTGKELEINL